jgi:hypothetical protein
MAGKLKNMLSSVTLALWEIRVPMRVFFWPRSAFQSKQSEPYHKGRATNLWVNAVYHPTPTLPSP